MPAAPMDGEEVVSPRSVSEGQVKGIAEHVKVKPLPQSEQYPMNKQQKKYGPKPRVILGKSVIGIYPEVLSEDITLDAVIHGRSIARYGDGELNIALGGNCISQRQVPDGMMGEMREILADPGPCAVGIPNPYSYTPKKSNWLKYATTEVVGLFKRPKYFSAFITRPDSAPWIDTPGYWDRMYSLWRRRHVMLVYGGPDSKSLKPDWLEANGALSVKPVQGKRTNAYMGIDELMETIGKPSIPVLICLGPTATCLAWRLAKKGVWAMDLGHVGMFIRSASAFSHNFEDLCSPEYAAVLKATHAEYLAKDNPWGRSTWRFFTEIKAFYDELGANTLLDYGCGQNTLRKWAAKQDPPFRVMSYDPGLEGMAVMPKPVDMVVCTEVLEHVEPGKLTAVLSHINALALKGAYLTIACSEAGETLSDGRNAHLIIESPAWWLEKMKGWNSWSMVRHEVEDSKKRVRIWLKRTDTGEAHVQRQVAGVDGGAAPASPG